MLTLSDIARDRPALHEMLAPTLYGLEGRSFVMLSSPETGRIAVLALRHDASLTELGLATRVHMSLERGALVLA